MASRDPHARVSPLPFRDRPRRLPNRRDRADRRTRTRHAERAPLSHVPRAQPPFLTWRLIMIVVAAEGPERKISNRVDLPCGRRVDRVGLVGGVRRHGDLAEPRSADGCVQRRIRGWGMGRPAYAYAVQPRVRFWFTERG